ncbi:MAG: putative adhesin, partial [Bacteroidota bacterium]
MKTTKNSNFNNLFLSVLFFNFCLYTSSFLRAQDATLRMDMEWLSSTTNTADFQVRITNLGTVPFKFNSVIVRGAHAASLTTGTVSWLALNNNTIPEWLGWPQTGTTILPYTVSSRKLNFSSSNAIFTAATAPTIPIPAGTGVIIGTFRVSTSTTWVPNSNFSFVWDATAAVIGYMGTSSTTSSLLQTGVSGGTVCGSCLTVTVPAAQLLNPQAVPPPSSSVLTGTATICSGSSTNLSVAVTGGVSPYTVIVTNGATNFSATSASPVSISVSPTTTSTYSIVSVTGGGTGTGNSGTPTVTVVPAPAATISYTGSPWCSSSAVQAVTQTGTTGGTYSSTAGLTINASTGAITPSTSTAGTYTVTYTIAAASPCAALSVTTSVTITAAQSATISYASSSICGSSTIDQSVTQTGTTGGTYSSSPSGLSISSTTGAITPNTSTIGTYIVTYTVAASGVCPAVSATTTITISSALTTPTITYAGSPFCKSLTSPQVVTQTGST